MSGNGLFSLNQTIGRKTLLDYSIQLLVIVVVSYFVINSFAKPNLANPDYKPIINFGETFLYVFYLLVFISLFERRITDIFGNRDELLYKIPVYFCFLAFFTDAYYILNQNKILILPQIDNAINIPSLCISFNMILLVLFIIICIIPGKITR